VVVVGVTTVVVGIVEGTGDVVVVVVVPVTTVVVGIVEDTGSVVVVLVVDESGTSNKQPPLEKALLTPVMGVAYIGSCTLLYIAAGVMRFTDGLVNVPVGLAMLASEKEPDTSLYEPVHGENAAVVAIHPSVASRQGRLGGVHLKGRAM
jgi:hypothetical protein